MKYSIYICDNCHTWQPPPVAESLTSLFDTIKGISTNVNFTPKPLDVSCSKGCGKMREVTTEDKIALFKQPSGFVVFPPDYTFAECMRHQKELRAELAQRDKILESAYALLLEYTETFPRETELNGRAQPLLNHVYGYFKKQEEGTDLFTVVSKCMHNFPNACNVTAQSDKDEIIATYYVDTHTWEMKVCRQQKSSISIGETKLKNELQEMASRYNISLTKGWKVINHQYRY